MRKKGVSQKSKFCERDRWYKARVYYFKKCATYFICIFILIYTLYIFQEILNVTTTNLSSPGFSVRKFFSKIIRMFAPLSLAQSLKSNFASLPNAKNAIDRAVSSDTSGILPNNSPPCMVPTTILHCAFTPARMHFL